MNEYMNFWGKADAETGSWHPLAYHMLDVAAVARVWVTQNEFFLQRWSEKLQMSEDETLDVVSFFAAIHDMGKFAADFQWKIPEIAQKFSRREKEPSPSPYHMQAGWVLYHSSLFNKYLENINNLPQGRPSQFARALEPLFSAAFGHHGAPVEAPNHYTVVYRDVFESGEGDAAEKLFLDLLEMFPGVKHLLTKTQDIKSRALDFKAFSFVLSGLIILSDWLASSENNFEHFIKNQSDAMNFLSLSEYWKKPAYEQAEKTLTRNGLNNISVYNKPDWEHLFPALAQQYNPNPLQKQMIDLNLSNGPGLYILEDIAGSGKTEAALLLTGRLMAQNESNGFYFALPTMATSNGMYHRLKEVYSRYFEDGQTPSLILAHGGSRLQKEFTDTIFSTVAENISEASDIAGELSQNGDTGLRPEVSSAVCHEWFADRSKKVFLAQAGVGSIDQALLASIYSRHNSLRLFGLSNRTLIVDEVHAYDVYMQKLLENLLQFQAAMGQSVLLLSATLPAGMKENLIKAYRKGLASNTEIIEDTAESTITDLKNAFSTPFPLFSFFADNKYTEMPVESRVESVREIDVELVYEPSQVYDILKEVHQKGKCAVWIRNTVGDVQNGYETLKEFIDTKDLLLFHSRFTMSDRQKIENTVLDTFGKESTPQTRKGKILIASQVVEQSLDLDFDCMVTDLCPIDLIIQRAGRLCRHSRDRNGQVVSSKDQRGKPRLHVYGPEPAADIQATWYSEYFKGGAFVYPQTDLLWRSSKVLKDTEKIILPGQARFLIESVYGDIAPDVPENLAQSALKVSAKTNKHEAMAERHCFPPENGFIKPSDLDPWNDDEKAVTRLTQDTIAYRMCVVKDSELQPFHFDEEHPWAMSQVKYRDLQIEYDALMKKQIHSTNRKLYDKGRGGRLLPVVKENDIWVSAGSLADDRKIIYDNKLGLRLEGKI